MAKTKVLARNWIIEVDTDPLATTPTGTPVWTKVGGVNTFTISSDKEDADTTDFDDGGYASHIVASRSNEITFEGFFIEDIADGSRDAGQDAVETFAEYIGPESIVPLRLTSPGGKVREWNGSFVTGDVGGGTNDPTSWGATFTPSGPPATVTP
jgi:hypothetical protein